MTLNTINTLKQALTMEVEGLCDAERKLAEVLPKLARAASSSLLRDAFNTHAAQTQQHFQRMQLLASSMEPGSARRMTAGISGLIADVQQMIDVDEVGVCKDVALIAVAQRIEYYEIAAYSNAQELADFLGLTDMSRVLTQILDEEYAASERLRDVCDQITREALDSVAA